MQMIDVVQKLREIASRSPEEIGRAITAAEAMSGRPVAEAKKPDDDGDGVPDWADKKPGKDDNEDKDDDGKKEGMSAKQEKYFGKKVEEDVSITLSGSDAVLAEILKLAGMIGAKTTAGPNAAPSPVTTAPMAPDPTLGMPTAPPPLPALGPMMGSGGPDAMDEPLVEPMMDDAFSASTSPTPTTMSINSAIPSGNDLAKPKITTPMTSPGNNPLHTSISFD
jgi:hypothetical protein